jgi:hypothetical protein
VVDGDGFVKLLDGLPLVARRGERAAELLEDVGGVVARAVARWRATDCS